MAVDAMSALMRALSFMALFQAAGVTIFIAIFGRQLRYASGSIRSIGTISALTGIVLVSVHYGLEAARMAGALAGAFDPTLQQLAFDSPLSTAWILRLVGLAFMAVAIRREGVRWISAGLVGVALVIVAFLFVGHSASHPDRAWLAPLLGMHLAIVSFWFGALAPLYLVSSKESAGVAAGIVNRFSRIAGGWVPAILVAGVLMTLVLVDRWAVFAEGYGLLLLVKAAAFIVLMWLAGLNKWRYGPAMAAAPSATAAFQRTVAIEYVLISIVLFATAIMTTFFSPES